ncbi:hypothetical protein [Streptomyces sp. NPDC088358]|uniref:hypothetical protein n=1 Tax=Streptomyces sp. NPDC088358 TaxID=3365857 RepID=UPI003816D54C
MTTRQFVCPGRSKGSVPDGAEAAAGGQVARRAGLSIAVLFRCYARIPWGERSRSPRLIAREPDKGG